MQKKNVLKHVSLVVLLSVSVSIGLNILLLLVNLPQYSERYQEASAILYAPPFWKQLLTSGLLIPIVEEVLFRRFGFRLLRRWLAFPWAAAISSVMFGAYHGNLVQFVYATICGMLLAYLCEQFDSVIAPILSHIAMNTAAIVLTHTGGLAWIMKRDIIAAIVVLFCGGISVGVLRALQKLDVTKVLKMYCKDVGNEI